MKRILTLVLTAFILGGLAVSLLACGQDSDSTTVTEEQVVDVQRGDLTIDITAVGNLAFAYGEELTFEVAGTVGEVLVEVGDTVEEGQVLAELDNTSIISLQEVVSWAEINLEQARIKLGDAEENLEEAQHPSELYVAQAEASVVNAKVALEAAQEVLKEAENPYTESDLVQAELAVINAEIALDNAEQSFEMVEERHLSSPSYLPWAQDYELKEKQLAIAESNLAEAEETLVEMMAGADPLEVEHKQKQLALAQANLEGAEDDLAEIQAWIEGDVGSWEVELKQLEVATAQAALEVDTAQAALDEAIELLQMANLVAPFAGIIISVDVEAGEVVNANRVVIELADPNKFETEILVSEMDILGIGEGATATIQIDALGGISLPAAVTSVSPIATIQSGVVNYKVTVELESVERLVLEPSAPDEEEESQEVTQSIDEVLDKAVAEERISQEQADMMKQRFSQMGASPTPEQLEQLIETFTQGLGGFAQRPGDFGQGPGGMLLENIGLKEGLTVTVNVIVEERDNVLLVPSSAITISGRQTYVQVLSPDGTIEERAITTGISDWQYTEVIEGLIEDEQVVVPQGTTTTPATQQDRPGGIMPFPGMGRQR